MMNYNELALLNFMLSLKQLVPKDNDAFSNFEATIAQRTALETMT